MISSSIIPGGQTKTNRIISNYDLEFPKTYYPGYVIHKFGDKQKLKALIFTALEDCNIDFIANSDCNIEMSLDKVDWQKFQSIDLIKGQSLYVRGNNTEFTGTLGLGQFEIIGKVSCEGNIMWLIDYMQDLIEIPYVRCFSNLFKDCDLVTAPELPATELTDFCYNSMFEGCAYLEEAPKLPAIELGEFCYHKMFNGCSSIETAPNLSATILETGCYEEMFLNCISLKNTQEILPAMLQTEFCYAGMFEGCTSLTTAPELPALGLVENCYNNMFKNCSKLNYIKAMFTITPTDDTTMDWVKGVAAEGTFVKNPSATWDVIGDNGVPTDWTIV